MPTSDEHKKDQDNPNITPAKAKKAMKETIGLVKKLGTGAAELLRKLKKDKSPEAMISTIEGDLSINQSRREEVSIRLEKLHNEIVEKKKNYASAPKARKRVIEMELKSFLSNYKSTERELGLLLENERVLSTVKGRINEIAIYGMRGISEDTIDDVTDAIEDEAAEADAILSATHDLEKAGRRRENDSDTESLWEELDGFEEAQDVTPESEPPQTADSDVSIESKEERKREADAV